ncbi:hypothetical protein [Streptomyces sp. NPDC002990]
MSQTDQERPERERLEQEQPLPERPLPEQALPEQPAADGPATGPAADRAQDLPRPSDLRELLTDGVVELRKRAELATGRAGAGTEDGITENYLETMARRAAERAGRPRA